MILRPELATRVFNTPLLMHPGKLDAALAGIGERIVEGGMVLQGTGERIDHIAFENGRPLAGRIGDRTGRRHDAAGSPVFDTIDGVALIPIEGTLVHKGTYVGAYSGRTSYEGLQAQVLRAMRNPVVKGVVFEVDSFGGELAGAFETADLIARLSAEKPTLAILTDHALSAGYLLASAARQIIIPEHGRAGSIGVVALHADLSTALEQQGIKVTVLRAGAQKMAANPFEPLADDTIQRLLVDLEAARSTFAESVELYRGTRFTAQAALATEAQDYRGYGGITFENYRGWIGGGTDAGDTVMPFIDPNEVHFFPLGTPNLFKTFFAPADYIETVNTLGLPRYAKAIPSDNNKSVRLEMQTNPLSLCLRPRALIKGLHH